jgi:4-hydroxy-tetrahydrodipicolinate synthase
MIALKPDFLKGSYPPIVTPFRDGEVDYETYAKLVERQVTEGSHGITVNGTTAEPSTLTIAERIRLLEVASRTVKGRIPVVAATGGQSLADSIVLTEAAKAGGADAVLIVTPYFIRPPQRGLIEYYLDLGKRTDLPVMIYHIPGRAAVNVTVDTVAAIADKLPRLVGLKHAFNDLNFVTQLLARLGMEFRIHVGLEDLSFPMLAVGASGLMNAVGNLLPRKVAQLYDLTAAGKMAEARALHYELYELNDAVFFDTNPIPMKYMMKRLGILPNEDHRLPMVPSTPELQKRLDGVLARAGLLAEGRAAAE